MGGFFLGFLKMDCWVCVCILVDVWVCVCCFCVWLTRKICCWVCVLARIGLCLCLVDKKWQENARTFGHVFLCLNLDLGPLELLLKMNSNLNSGFFWILILFFLFYFVIIYKLICFFKMGGWRGIFIIILLATSVFTVQTMHFVCHVGYFC